MPARSQLKAKRYRNQRPNRVPPHAPLAALRHVAGITLDELAELIEQQTGDRPSRGALSAIERGHRGVSAELLGAIEAAYRLPSGTLAVDYVPRSSSLQDDRTDEGAVAV